MNPKGKKQKLVGWGEIDFLVNFLVKKLPKGKYKSVFGVPRGGLIPAVLLSHKLGIRLVDFQHINRDTLIVDDIADSGKTLKAIMDTKWDRKPHTAVIYLCESSIFEPKYFAAKKDPTIDWIVFPWETAMSSKYDLTFNVAVNPKKSVAKKKLFATPAITDD